MALKLPDFAEETDKWQAYLVKIDAYFEANEVTDDAKKRALLVAALGSRTVEILCGRIAPRKPSSLSYEEVVSTLNEHYDPSPNEISESFKFFHRNQQEGESVQAFIVEIRKLAHNCNFSSMLERMLRDRIVCGVRSKNLQKQLLAKKDLTLAEAEALAIAAESAELGSQQMTGQDCEGPSLCGRDLLQMLETQGAPLLHIASLSSDGKLESRTAAPVLEQYADLFAEGLGAIKGPPARLHIKDGATPRFGKEEVDQEDEAQVLTLDQWDQPALPWKELQALAVADEVLFQAKEPVNWPETHERWSRLHVDYAGPVKGKMLLIVVDAPTKWIEALPVSQANSHSTVEALRTIFSRFGIPRTVVSDNGTPFTAREFEQFMERNGIAHIRTPPYHPQSNGLAERAVRTIKDGLKKIGGTCLLTSLARVLCNYRNAPHQEGPSPSERLLGYRLRTRMEMSFPSRVYPAKAASDPGWNFAPGDYVYVRNYGAGDKWFPGTVEATRGTRLLEVKTVDGLVRRHVDQVRKRSPDETPAADDMSRPSTPVSPGPVRLETTAPATSQSTPESQPYVLRRSTRAKKPVVRFGY
ncbi:uncharacterized protein LOC142765983 [Rhipicephalus microplus]|uniref:uncharacterized protein LOC142765983 n=1 Tax=Rhipicephalus microplus TaxID=6941 RepID=UPI003F6BDA94